MERLIPVVNRLQDVLNAVGADSSQIAAGLPQLAAVGSQSSGKSSVLEGLVGRDFLPRGTGIVTRRPLVLQLVHVPSDASSVSSLSGSSEKGPAAAPPVEWGEFLHKPNEMFTDFDEIRREIEAETDREAGKNKGISDRPINLKIFSPNVVNLTIVDLPGIARVPVGDQPHDIEVRIRQLVMTYISKPDTLILTVSAANQDLANSDGLQLARSVDPAGDRTIGVITKLDLMDKGTEQHGVDMLLGRVIPLKLGFIGVVNRSQSDIDSRKRIRDAIRAEAKFFAQSPVFRVVSARSGMPFLAKSLNRILINHIRDTLPALRQRVQRMLHDAENELAGYGEDYSAESRRGALVLQILTRFAHLYADAIDGRLGATVVPVIRSIPRTDGERKRGGEGKRESDSGPIMQTSMDDQFNNPLQHSSNELYGGARLHHVFTEIFSKRLATVEPSEGLSPQLVRATMRNATGPRGTLFVPESAFEVLTRREIARLEDPSLQCVELAHVELQRIVSQLETRELLRFPRLREAIVGASLALLDDLRAPCRSHVRANIAVESSYINTAHPDFIGGDGAITLTLETMAADREEPSSEGATRKAEAPPLPQKPPATDDFGRVTTTQPRPPQQTSSHPVSPQASGQQGFFNMFFGGKHGKGSDHSDRSDPRQRSDLLAARDQQLSASGGRVEPPTSGSSVQSAFRVKELTPEEAEAREARRAARRAAAEQRKSDREGRERPASGATYLPGHVNATLSQAASEKEEFETRLILCLIGSYFGVVRKTVSDSIPKAVMHFLVNSSKQQLQSHLVSQLYREDRFDELLTESTAIAERRNACRKMVDVLQRANRILNEVREYQA